MSTLRLVPALALCLVSLTGCARLHVDDGRHVDERLSTLEQEEEIRRARLAELERQISSAEQRVTAAKADAQFQECRATQTKLAAEIEITKADCVRVVAERGACLAKNESRTTKGTGLGCAAGWVTAFLTGGAAAPLVVAGCAGGAVLSHGARIAAFQGTLPQDLVDPQVMLTSGRATASMRLTCASE